MTRPVIPIAQITAAAQSNHSNGLRLEFTDSNGRQGALEISPSALATIQQAIAMVPAALVDRPVLVAEVATSAKAALTDGSGGYGLYLEMTGGSSPVLLKIPAAMIPGLQLQLQELEAFSKSRSTKLQ